MRETKRLVKGTWMTIEEHLGILRQCRKCLDDVAAHGTLEGPVPASDRIGWSYSWVPLKRDRDGSLLVEIGVSAPHLLTTYVRRYRLVQRQRLLRGLRSELRES